MKEQFPNLAAKFNEIVTAFDGRFMSDNNVKMAYMMPVMTFNKHVGDNWLILEKIESGYQLTIESQKGTTLKVKTNANRIVNSDLPFDEWGKLLNETMMTHSMKKDYREFSSGNFSKNMEKALSGGNSGCMVILFIPLSILVSYLCSIQW